MYCHSERSEESWFSLATDHCSQEVNLLSMMLALSLVLSILPLLGVVWTLMNGMITTGDELFMSLILLTLSGVFMINAYWEMRDMGLIKKKTPTEKKTAAPAAKTPTTHVEYF